MQNVRSRLLAFANAQTHSQDIVEWTESFKHSLSELLPMASRISVNVNRGCSVLGDTASYSERISIMRPYVTHTEACDVVIASTGLRDADHFLGLCRRSGFPVDDYQDPLCLNYHGGNGEYMGSIVIWLLTGSAPIPTSQIQLLKGISRFVISIFASAIQRFQERHREYATALRTINGILESAQLTRREREVFAHRFQGHSVPSTAARLNISEATVRRHIRAIRGRLRDHCTVSTRVLGVPFATPEDHPSKRGRAGRTVRRSRKP